MWGGGTDGHTLAPILKGSKSFTCQQWCSNWFNLHRVSSHEVRTVALLTAKDLGVIHKSRDQVRGEGGQSEDNFGSQGGRGSPWKDPTSCKVKI